MTGVSLRRGAGDTDTRGGKENHVRTQEVAVDKPREEETNPAVTLISDFQPPGL